MLSQVSGRLLQGSLSRTSVPSAAPAAESPAPQSRRPSHDLTALCVSAMPAPFQRQRPRAKSRELAAAKKAREEPAGSSSQTDLNASFDTKRGRSAEIAGSFLHHATDTLYFYSETEGEHRSFSLVFECKFKGKDEKIYQSAFQYLNAQKALLFDDIETYEAVLACGQDIPAIKENGYKVKGFDPERWEAESENIVYEANLFKFKQNQELAAILLKTGENRLAECSLNLQFGIGINLSQAIAGEKWLGENRLGLALQKVRKHLREERMNARRSSVSGHHLDENARPQAILYWAGWYWAGGVSTVSPLGEGQGAREGEGAWQLGHCDARPAKQAGGRVQDLLDDVLRVLLRRQGAELLVGVPVPRGHQTWTRTPPQWNGALIRDAFKWTEEDRGLVCGFRRPRRPRSSATSIRRVSCSIAPTSSTLRGWCIFRSWAGK